MISSKYFVDCPIFSPSAPIPCKLQQHAYRLRVYDCLRGLTKLSSSSFLSFPLHFPPAAALLLATLLLLPLLNISSSSCFKCRQNRKREGGVIFLPFLPVSRFEALSLSRFHFLFISTWGAVNQDGSNGTTTPGFRADKKKLPFLSFLTLFFSIFFFRNCSFLFLFSLPRDFPLLTPAPELEVTVSSLSSPSSRVPSPFPSSS